MWSAKCLKKSLFKKGGNFLKFSQKIKPVFQFIMGKQRTNVVTPSTCNYDVVECAQNYFNESELVHLHFKFLEETTENEVNKEVDENTKNEELEKRLHQNVEAYNGNNFEVKKIVNNQTIWPTLTGIYYATPIHLVKCDKLLWAPMSDIDICRSEDEPLTCYQFAEQQTPVGSVLS